MDVRLVCNGVVEDRGVDELQKLLEGEDGFVWVNIPAGDEEAVHVLSEVFRFHPMAVKDAVEQNRLPKMHAYHDHVFVVLHAPEGRTPRRCLARDPGGASADPSRLRPVTSSQLSTLSRR